MEGIEGDNIEEHGKEKNKNKWEEKKGGRMVR